MPFDWQQFHASETRTPAVVDPRRRLRICLAAFVAVLLLVFGRAVQLEVTQGAGFRAEALRPVEKQTVLPAARGRILARDGTALACDRKVRTVAVQYRWLQEPPNAGWLRVTTRARMSKANRKDAAKVAAEQAKVLAERVELARQLARLCGLSPEQWAARAKQIQTRVQRIADSANRRRQSEAASSSDALSNDSWAARLRRLLLEDPPPPRIVVAEELDYHVMADDAPPAAVAEIENRGDRYPGVKVVELSRRFYPGGAQAAHVLGHLGAAGEGELVGRMGVERQYESVLQGHRGTAVEQTDRGGRVLARYDRQPPAAGHDVTLTLDPALQRTAEELLQSALQRRAIRPEATEPAGGAIVVMEVETGAIRAAASAPAFDPNLFARGGSEELAAVLADKTHPLFDRVCRMAIPPGSTFKVLAAAALLESAAASPEERFTCQGYLHQPDRQRCEIYIRQGVGHGEVALADALAVSCNTYFFHFAGRMGPRPLVDWATRFGFGRPTGIDLPGEAAGTLPCPENIRQLEGHAWRTADTQSMAVGQGSLTATPLQVLCMMAAVANGGRLATPHVARGVGGSLPTQRREIRAPPPQPIPGLQGKTLRTIREGLRRVVADPQGTAHGTLYIESLAVAGKTGTAETGADRASHAWFAGYVPAEEPKLAMVVVLEHAGEAATAAGPVAKRLVLRMEQLGML
jgi:penicillin-binding protein 2